MTSPKESDLRAIDVLELLPQRPPFVMIGEMTMFTDTMTASETLLTADNIFVDERGLMAEGLMENIAQTCASRIGYYNKYICNGDIKIGLIGAVRDYKIERRPQAGETISTVVSINEEVMGVTLADATVKVGDEEIATAQIKLAIFDASQTQNVE